MKHIPTSGKVYSLSSNALLFSSSAHPQPKRRHGIFAVEYIRRMRGGTQSHMMRCSNGCYYVVKFQNNPQGKRILVNELLGARLAEWLGIPVARADIISVDPGLVDASEECRVELPASCGTTRVPCLAGRCFGSRYPGDPHQVQVWDFVGETQLRACKNASDFAGMLLFDIWTSNLDRRQTVFFRDEGEIRYRTIMIDQGNCFGAEKWTLEHDDHRRFFDRRCPHKGIQGIQDFEPWLSRLENEIDQQYLRRVAAEIPEEWYDGDTESLNRLLEQLDQERQYVRRRIVAFAATHYPFFPNWR